MSKGWLSCTFWCLFFPKLPRRDGEKTKDVLVASIRLVLEKFSSLTSLYRNESGKKKRREKREEKEERFWVE